MVNKFILIEVIGREISEPFIFDTLEKAQTKMKALFFEALGLQTEEEINSFENSEVAGISKFSAFCKTSNHDNWDAKIFQMI